MATPDGPASLRVHPVGPHPILRHFLERMSFTRIVRACLSTPREAVLDHAQTLSILIQNFLLSPAPLYRIAEWAAPIAPEALGLSAREKRSLNDDRIARALDALASPRAGNLFFRLALHVIKHFELDTQRIHQDTTSVTFHGRYETSWSEPRIAHGHNKDHRPDLKQLVFGVSVCADGAVPVSHHVYSGNRTDDTVHRSNLDALRQLLGREEFIYVADSKLCTQKNLAYIDAYGGKFVTVLPRTRAEDSQFRAQLGSGAHVRWRKLLVLPNARRTSDPPNVYSTTPHGPAETREGYRVVWYRSSQKAELDQQFREATLDKARAELADLDTRLNRGRLSTRPAIRNQVHAILRRWKCQAFLTVRLGSRTRIQRKRLRRGRPRRDDPVREVRTAIFHLEVKREAASLRAAARTDGVFPLVTNLEPSRASKKKILQIYKYQSYVEKRHALLKSELEVAPVFLKKPHRVVGLLHASYLAMTLDALIERNLRQAMQQQGIESLPILPEGRPTRTPTTARLLEMFTGVCWYQFEREEETVTFPIQLTALQKQLLQLLGMDPSAYA